MQIRTIRMSGRAVSYRHQIRPSMQRITLSIQKDGVLTVRSPRISLKELEQILLRKEEWILSTLDTVANRREESLSDGATVLYAGRRLVLRIEPDVSRVRAVVSLAGDEVVMRLNPHFADDTHVERGIHALYRARVRAEVPKWLAKWEPQVGRQAKGVSYTNAKSRWGSCSGRGSLSFSIFAARLPDECLEYLVLHELCHLVHHNHSAAFWGLMTAHMPDAYARRQKMKLFGGT